MEATTTDWLLVGMGWFCFGYPFVMAWYWMAGGLLFYFTRERYMAPPDRPPLIEHRRHNLNSGAVLQRG